jgi:ABC-2 type transport system permease protein
MNSRDTQYHDAPFLIHGTNWLGMATLYRREMWRFLKVWNQTVAAPVVTTLIWLAILTLALGGNRGGGVEHIPFNEFIAPGLIMMSVMQNAFANTSSSLMLAKVQGVIVDVLMPPLTAGEITAAYVGGGVTRGVMVGATVGIAISLFVPVGLAHPLLAVVYLLLASTMLALLGLLGGLWAQGFDQMSAVTNYVITPLSFLSGTFYSVDALPGMWHVVCYYNPFFYVIDGFRYAITGYHDGSIAVGLSVICALNIVLWLCARHVLRTGWRLKT